jgi:hypothetical protein
MLGLLAMCLGAAGLATVVGVAAAQEPLDAPVGTTEEAPRSEPSQPETPEPEKPAAEPGGTGGDAAVELDQLLRLPNSLDFKEERRGGGGAADWRRRFSESERRIRKAEAKLEETETALSEAGTAGSGQWQIAPPGQQANASDSGPLSFKLREELRRARAALEEAERQHRALIVEADLAGVPEDWRRTSQR